MTINHLDTVKHLFSNVIFIKQLCLEQKIEVKNIGLVTKI